MGTILRFFVQTPSPKTNEPIYVSSRPWCILHFSCLQELLDWGGQLVQDSFGGNPGLRAERGRLQETATVSLYIPMGPWG